MTFDRWLIPASTDFSDYRFIDLVLNGAIDLFNWLGMGIMRM